MKKSLLVCGLVICLGVHAAKAEVLKIQEITTPKNIKVWLVKDHTVPVISMQFLFRGAGSVNDPEDKQGLSQLLSNTLDEGAGDLDAKAFQAKLTDLSIGLGFSSSRDDFGGSLKTLTKYSNEAFGLLNLALTSPRFEEEAVNRMKEANLARIKSNMTDPEWMAARLSNAVIFEDHPYAMNSGGTLTSLPRITADDLRQKVKTELGLDRLIIAVAGNITKEDLSKKVDEIFGNLASQSTVKSLPKPAFPKEPKPIQYDKDIPQTLIQVAFPGIRNDDPDYFVAEIVNYVFGGAGFGSRLTDVVREKQGLTYGIYSDLSQLDHSELFSIATSTRFENVAEVQSLIESELDKIRKQGITEEELKTAKSYLIGSVPLGLTSTDRIAGMMIGFQSYNLPPNYLDLREKGLSAVTLKDTQRVAMRLANPSEKLTILVGKLEDPASVRQIEKIPDIE